MAFAVLYMLSDISLQPTLQGLRHAERRRRNTTSEPPCISRSKMPEVWNWRSSFSPAFVLAPLSKTPGMHDGSTSLRSRCP